MLRLYITMLLLFLLTRLCVAAERDVSLSAAGPGDTIGAPPSERVTRFYDSLESKSTRRTVPRLIYRSIFIRGRRDTLGRDRVVDESKRFEPMPVNASAGSFSSGAMSSTPTETNSNVSATVSMR